MRRLLLLLILTINCTLLMAQPSTIKSYTKKTYMVPVRDGVKLYTVVLSPVSATSPLPILIERTPYGADLPEDVDLTHWPYFGAMAKEGYIFVFQDIRGKYKSEGTMQIHQPLIHAVRKGAIDESTDTYDTVDWLGNPTYLWGVNPTTGVFQIQCKYTKNAQDFSVYKI